MRALYCTKMIEIPLSVLKYKVERMLGRKDPIVAYDQLEMFTYDGHET